MRGVTKKGMDKEVGVTPLEEFSVAPGRLDVLVNLSGVGAWRRSVEAAAGESLVIDAPLRAAAAAPATPGPTGAWEVGGEVTAPRRLSGAPVAYPEAAL